MSRATPSCFAVLTLACVVGCGGDSYSVEDYWRELATMHCQRMRDCCTTAEYQDWWTGMNGTQDCQAVWQHPPASFDIKQAIDDGRIDFDPVAAHACIEALGAQACSGFEPAYRYHETYCESPLHGRVPDGSQCDTDGECKSTRCFFDPNDLQHRGVCKPLIERGSACEFGLGCARPDVCQDNGVCGLGLPAGSQCSSDFDCTDHWCKNPGLFTPGTCTRACDGP